MSPPPSLRTHAHTRAQLLTEPKQPWSGRLNQDSTEAYESSSDDHGLWVGESPRRECKGAAVAVKRRTGDPWRDGVLTPPNAPQLPDLAISAALEIPGRVPPPPLSRAPLRARACACVCAHAGSESKLVLFLHHRRGMIPVFGGCGHFCVS